MRRLQLRQWLLLLMYNELHLRVGMLFLLLQMLLQLLMLHLLLMLMLLHRCRRRGGSGGRCGGRCGGDSRDRNSGLIMPSTIIPRYITVSLRHYCFDSFSICCPTSSLHHIRTTSHHHDIHQDTQILNCKIFLILSQRHVGKIITRST